MKMWTRRDEWVDLAACVDSGVHTAENPTDDEVVAAQGVCDQCIVRPECIEWAIRDSACSVFVAGRYLPDPQFKRELRTIYNQLRESVAEEKRARGTI